MKASSPITLTEFGEEISSAVSANEWAYVQAPELAIFAAGKEEFEVFELCVEHIQSLFSSDSDFQRTVRAAAYQHGTEAEQVLKVYQVVLRDRVLDASRWLLRPVSTVVCSPLSEGLAQQPARKFRTKGSTGGDTL